MRLAESLRTIKRWLQQEDDALEYEPDGLRIGGYPIGGGLVVISHDDERAAAICPCEHCRNWRDEHEPYHISLPEIEVVSYELSTVDIEGLSFGEAWAEVERRINARHGRANE